MNTVESARLPFHPPPSDFTDPIQPNFGPVNGQSFSAFASARFESHAADQFRLGRRLHRFALGQVDDNPDHVAFVSGPVTCMFFGRPSFRVQPTYSSCLCSSSFDFAAIQSAFGPGNQISFSGRLPDVLLPARRTTAPSSPSLRQSTCSSCLSTSLFDFC